MLTSGLCSSTESLRERVKLSKPSSDLSEVFIIWLPDVYQGMVYKEELHVQKDYIFSLCKLLFPHQKQPGCCVMSPSKGSALQPMLSYCSWLCPGIFQSVLELSSECLHSLYKRSKERFLDLVCNKSSAFRSAELETIIEILVPHIQTRKLESSVPPVGQMPLEFHELLGTSDRAGRRIPAVVSCTVCLHGAWLWRHCSLLQVR